MAELRSSDVLSKQDIKNKKIDNRLAGLEDELTTLETDIDNRLDNLEFTRRINITQEGQKWQNSTIWYAYNMLDDQLNIANEFSNKFVDNPYSVSESTPDYIFQCYLRVNKVQLTCTTITHENSDFVFNFGDTTVRMEINAKRFRINLSNQPCQLVLHYSLL